MLRGLGSDTLISLPLIFIFMFAASARLAVATGQTKARCALTPLRPNFNVLQGLRRFSVVRQLEPVQPSRPKFVANALEYVAALNSWVISVIRSHPAMVQFRFPRSAVGGSKLSQGFNLLLRRLLILCRFHDLLLLIHPVALYAILVCNEHAKVDKRTENLSNAIRSMSYKAIERSAKSS